MPAEVDLAAVRRSILDNGFAIIPDILDGRMLSLIDDAVDRSVAAAPVEHFDVNRTTGSMLSVADDPAFAALIGWPRTLAILRGLAFGEVVWQSGYIIRKPGGGPRLFWHQDWLFWTHPVSREAVPHQLFAMYYLNDTTRENGCLRVIPGSHRRHLAAHDRLAKAHSPQALAGSDPDHPMFGNMPGETDVPVRAGDLLLGDSRLLHAAHANTTSAPRTLVTLWYHLAYDRIPNSIQTWLADRYGKALASWPLEARERVGCVLPYSTDDSSAWPIDREPVFTP